MTDKVVPLLAGLLDIRGRLCQTRDFVRKLNLARASCLRDEAGLFASQGNTASTP